MKSEDIEQFLISHPLISLRALEVESGLPENTLHRVLNPGNQKPRKIPKKHLAALASVLEKYGFAVSKTCPNS